MCNDFDCLECPLISECPNVNEDARRTMVIHEIRIMFAEIEHTRRTKVIHEIRELFETTIYAIPPKPLYDESEERTRMMFCDLHVRHYNLYVAQMC